MTQQIRIDLQRAAVGLADELDYTRAAIKVGMTPSELREHISELEGTLGLDMFVVCAEGIQITNEGLAFVMGCRTFLTTIGVATD